MAISGMKFCECPHCKHINEPPFFFCANCGEAGVKLGRWLVMFNLSLTFSLFLGASYFRPVLSWNWPLFLLYYIFLAQFALSLVRGYWRLCQRVLLWIALTIAAFYVFFHFLFEEGAGIFFLTLGEVPAVAKEYPLIFFPTFAAVLVPILVPAYFRWARIYGWVMSYRILMILGLIACLLPLGILRLLHIIEERNWMPTEQEWLAQFLYSTAPEFKKVFLLVFVSLFRLFLFEIAVFSAVQGYTRVHRAARIKGKITYTGESGFVRALMHISLIVMRISQTMQYMAAYLISTLLILIKDLTKVLLALTREVIIPFLMMVISGLLIYRLVTLTDVYILSGNLKVIPSIAFSILGLLFSIIIFLYCKTAFRWRKIISFYTNLAGWLLPNLLLFFLLLSISLYLSGSAINRLEPERDNPLPFRIGILTILDAAILLVLVAVVLIRKGSQFRLGDVAKFVLETRAQTPVSIRPSPDLKGRAETEIVSVELVPVGTKEELAKIQKKKPEKFFSIKWLAELQKRLRKEEEQKPGALKFVRKTIKTLESKKATRTLVAEFKDLYFLLKGKPRIVTELAKLKLLCQEKQAQLLALGNQKDSISEKLFTTLSSQYRDALEQLTKRRDELQAEVDKQYAEQFLRVSTEKVRLEEIKQRKAEVEQLHHAGAMSEEDYRKHLRKFKNELETLTLIVEGCEKTLAFLAEEATPAPNSQGS